LRNPKADIVTQKFLSVAIDGPAGAGKSTTARRLAQELGIVYVDSGAMYRAVALACSEVGIAFDDDAEVAEISAKLTIEFAPALTPGGPQQIFVDGNDVTTLIRTPQISGGASTVSTIPAVREVLVAKQRAMGEKGGVVMEGRDIGTVVLPGATCKIFLTASLDERARRRFSEMSSRGDQTTFVKVKADIAERDFRDQTRAASPLRPAEDAIILDSESMDADNVVATMLELCKKAAEKSA
jgi:CMP/dCMP kinase